MKYWIAITAALLVGVWLIHRPAKYYNLPVTGYAPDGTPIVDPVDATFRNLTVTGTCTGCVGSGGNATFTALTVTGNTILSTFTALTGTLTNLIAGPGQIQLTGNSKNGTDQISGVNVNAVVNALTYPGTDFGDQVNAAEAALPGTIGGACGTFNNSALVPGALCTGHYGTVLIPNTLGPTTPVTYSYTNTIVLNQNVMLKCDPGVVLSYKGTTDAILQNNPGTSAMFTATGGVTDCTILKDPSNTHTGVNGIHFGNTNGLAYVHDQIDNFSAVGDSGMLAENTIYQTEHCKVDISAEQDYHAITFNKNCGTALYCGPSLLYNWIHMSHCGPVYGGYGDCINVTNGAGLDNSFISFHANTIGLGQALFAVDATSTLGNNSIDVAAENDANVLCTPAPTCAQSYYAKVATGGLAAWNVGPVMLGANGIANWVDRPTMNGMVGMYLDAGAFNNYVRVETPGVISMDYQGTGDATLYAGAIHPSQINGIGHPVITGGGFLAGGSTNMWGSIGTPAATGNVLTPGVTCPSLTVAIFKDITGTADSIAITAETPTTITFNANSNAGHSLNYWAGCI